MELKREPCAGELVLAFAGEAAVSTNPYPARTEAGRRPELRVDAPVSICHCALFGARAHASGELIESTSRGKDNAPFCGCPLRLKPRARSRPPHLALDKGPVQRSRPARAALAKGEESLPADAPELNDIECAWLHLKTDHLAHQTSTQIGISTAPSLPALATSTTIHPSRGLLSLADTNPATAGSLAGIAHSERSVATVATLLTPNAGQDFPSRLKGLRTTTASAAAGRHGGYSYASTRRRRALLTNSQRKAANIPPKRPSTRLSANNTVLPTPTGSSD
jgi:hypothetical protein